MGAKALCVERDERINVEEYKSSQKAKHALSGWRSLGPVFSFSMQFMSPFFRQQYCL